jgi:hypothetical protein
MLEGKIVNWLLNLMGLNLAISEGMILGMLMAICLVLLKMLD